MHTVYQKLSRCLGKKKNKSADLGCMQQCINLISWQKVEIDTTYFPNQIIEKNNNNKVKHVLKAQTCFDEIK